MRVYAVHQDTSYRRCYFKRVCDCFDLKVIILCSVLLLHYTTGLYLKNEHNLHFRRSFREVILYVRMTWVVILKEGSFYVPCMSFDNDKKSWFSVFAYLVSLSVGCCSFWNCSSCGSGSVRWSGWDYRNSQISVVAKQRCPAKLGRHFLLFLGSRLSYVT